MTTITKIGMGMCFMGMVGIFWSRKIKMNIQIKVDTETLGHALLFIGSATTVISCLCDHKRVVYS